MDKSAVEAIVEAHMNWTMWSCNVSDWHIEVNVGRLEDHMGQCSPDYRYHSAHITIDNEECDDETDVLETLRHEVLHCTSGVMHMYQNIAEACAKIEHKKEESVRNYVMGKIEEFAVEEMVRRMEGLMKTHAIPLHTPDWYKSYREQYLELWRNRLELGGDAAHGGHEIIPTSDDDASTSTGKSK